MCPQAADEGESGLALNRRSEATSGSGGRNGGGAGAVELQEQSVLASEGCSPVTDRESCQVAGPCDRLLGTAGIARVLVTLLHIDDHVVIFVDLGAGRQLLERSRCGRWCGCGRAATRGDGSTTVRHGLGRYTRSGSAGLDGPCSGPDQGDTDDRQDQQENCSQDGQEQEGQAAATDPPPLGATTVLLGSARRGWMVDVHFGVGGHTAIASATSGRGCGRGRTTTSTTSGHRRVAGDLEGLGVTVRRGQVRELQGHGQVLGPGLGSLDLELDRVLVPSSRDVRVLECVTIRELGVAVHVGHRDPGCRRWWASRHVVVRVAQNDLDHPLLADGEGAQVYVSTRNQGLLGSVQADCLCDDGHVGLLSVVIVSNVVCCLRFAFVEVRIR